MSIVADRKTTPLQRAFSAWQFFVVLWIILFLVLLLGIKYLFSDIVFGLATVLIFTHVIYGGYFLFKKEGHVNDTVVILTAAIYTNLIFYTINTARPLVWFIFMEGAFLFAIALHLYYRSRLRQTYLKEFCNYKVYVEITGMIFAALGIVFCLIFPSHREILALIVIAAIIKFNLTVLRKKKLYRIAYPDPAALSSGSPLVSIVIIAYNEEKYIGGLLESIAAQDYGNYEIIIVDDKSTDKTVETAKGYAGKLPIRILQKETRGVSASRNFGAASAKGEIILFLDADVIMPPDFFSRNLRDFFDQKLSIAGVDLAAISENKLDFIITGFYRRWLKLVQYFNPRGIGFCLFVYKKLHDQILFDERVVMSEDFDYVKRASERGKFRILCGACIQVSWRRFHRENRFLLTLKYLFFEWYRQNIGEIRRKLLPYEFGK